MAGKKGRKPSVVAKGKKKLAHRPKNEPSSPDPFTSDSGGSVLPIKIYKGSPDRVEYPRPAKRKRKTSESPANPAIRRDVVKTPDDADLVDSPAAPREPSLSSRSQTKAKSKVKRMKTPTSQSRLSKGAVEKGRVESSDRVEINESYNDSSCSRSMSVVQDPNGTTSTANHDFQYGLIEFMICKDFAHVSGWDDISVDAKLKRAMTNQILIQLALPMASNTGMAAGILLHGVPGCGKTYLCLALAKAAGVTFFNVECSSLISKWQGDSEKMVQLLFKIAIERQPSMIFIGEVEGLMKQREGSDTFSVENIKRDILVKMSNVQAKKHLVTVIGASNRPYVLDEAFVRRFTLRLHVPPPDTILKVRLLQTLLDDVTHHLSEDDIRRLADDRVLEGASVAHIIDVIHTLNRDLVGLIAEAEYFDKTTQEDGLEVIVPYKHKPTLQLPKGIVHCSWKDFTLEERRLLRPNAVVYEDLYNAFEDSPSPIDAATLRQHLQWSKKFGSRRTG